MECRKQGGGGGKLWTQFHGKDIACCFLFQLFFTTLSSMRVRIEYVCVRDIYYIRLDDP